MPAGTAPTAPSATTPLAGTGPTGPGRNSSAAAARCGSIFQFAVFITDQTPLKLGWPPTRSIAPPAVALWVAAVGAWAAAVGAALLAVSVAIDPSNPKRANTFIFLFRTFPLVSRTYNELPRRNSYFSLGSAPSFGAPVPLEPMNTLRPSVKVTSRPFALQAGRQRASF